MRQTIDYPSATSYAATVGANLLAGYTILSVTGCTIQIGGASVTLPHTLTAGEVLAVTHTAGTSLSNLRLQTPDDGQTAGSSAGGVARLASTAGQLLPLALPPFSGSPITVANQPYGVILEATFDVTNSTPLEGVTLNVVGITGGTLQGVTVTSGGVGLDLGAVTISTQSGTPQLMTATFARPRNVPPGTYVVQWTFTADAVLQVYPTVRLYNGMTGLISYATGAGTTRTVGAGVSLLTGPQTIVGRLDPGGMNTVSTPSTDPAQWFARAVEIVYPAGSAPYLRTLHEGQNYRLDLVLDAPPPGGGEAS
ncbi:hypothetical protein [Deinococcus aquiradiocola]|uniref:Uncharacterized protein n=1 Tax=Deinococcus aquiradiocola TaxID=393059 RepID=A0A917P7F4_9DEIO|nr:hypothetical protein [Deinococcus aquiradiocola]GGJ65409.1 hypothetical protein GCM10008939_06690 [Deinococcus aquiradiocola]